MSVDEKMGMFKMLLDVGFKEIEVYSDFNVYNEECERNIFVCKKG